MVAATQVLFAVMDPPIVVATFCNRPAGNAAAGVLFLPHCEDFRSSNRNAIWRKDLNAGKESRAAARGALSRPASVAG